MKNFRSKWDLLFQWLGRVEVAEEKGSLQVEFLEESAWADFAKSLISEFHEDEKVKGRRGDIPAVMLGMFQHVASEQLRMGEAFPFWWAVWVAGAWTMLRDRVGAYPGTHQVILAACSAKAPTS